MRKRQIDFGCLPFLRIVGIAALASLTTACSSDSLRFSETPFANPFQGRIDSAATNTATKRISSTNVLPSQPLPAKTSSTLTAAARAVSPDPVSGGVAGWTATGGTPITVGAGDTIDALSSRYGVPASALRAANGLSSGQPSAGQKLLIPAYNPGAAVTKVAASSQSPVQTSGSSDREPAKARTPRYEPLAPVAPKAAPVAAKAAPAPAKVERKPRYEPIQAAATPRAKPLAKPAVKAADDDEDDRPVVKKAEPKQVAKPAAKPVAKADKNVTGVNRKLAKASVKQVVDDEDDQPMPPKPSKTTRKPAQVATVTPKGAVGKPEAKGAPEAQKAPETTAAVEQQEFRWPARGRVISGYGSKGPSGTNDGINIAVPEGTPVKASEAGTVAYSGEEIKGYGKMILVRHPNGYVSAYAHNGELNVKRGDVVKRGQLIAKSGQTGNVTSPQLHFELRKGSDPVDPSKYLD